MTDPPNRIAAFYPILSGALFLGLGLLTMIRPEVLEYYSIGVDSASARTAIRAMIGGGEIGLGTVLLGGHRWGFSLSQRCILAAVVFICVGLTRLVSSGLEFGFYLAHQPLREAAIELILGCVGVLSTAKNLARNRAVEP
ncbi:MAG: DUF4345 family protein [Pseudomonadota bacterium]